MIFFSECRKSLQLLKRNAKSIIIFELLFKFVLAAVFTPLFLWLFQLSIQWSGYTYLSSSMMIDYLAHPTTLLLLLLIMTGITFVTLFDILAVIQCLNASQHDQTLTVLQMCLGGLSQAKRVFDKKNWFLIIFVVLLIPLTGVVAVSGYVSSIQIPEFILDFIAKNTVLSLLLLFVELILFLLAFRWGFSIHTFAFDSSGYKEARKKSEHLIKGRYIRTLFGILAWQIIMFLLVAFAVLLLFIIAGVFIKLAIRTESQYTAALNTIGMLSSIAVILPALFSVPITFAQLSTMYYKYKKEDGLADQPYQELSQPHFSRFIRMIGAIVAAAILVSDACSIYTRAKESYAFEKKLILPPQITAHRGSSAQAPENNIPAFEQAIADDADWIELDVHQTKDGVIVVTHDEDLNRIAGVDKNVWELSYEELEQYDVGSWFSEEFKDLHVATLDDVLKLCKGKIKVNIELKPTGHEQDFEQGVLDVIEENNFREDCVVASLDESTLMNMRELDPDITTLYIMAVALGDINAAPFADAFSIEASFITPQLVTDVHNSGKQLLAWTLNTEDGVDKMRDLNVDNIITDDPIMAQQALSKDLLQDEFGDFIAHFFQPYQSDGSFDQTAI